MEGWTDVDTVKQAGKMLNADCIIVGSVATLGCPLYITARMIEVETGKILHSAKMSLDVWSDYEKQLLSDYKVIVLTLDENSVEPQLLNELLEGNADLKESDAIKLIGCINVLSKRTNYLTDKELFSDVDPEPMKSAVAFCSNIKNSLYLKDSFNVCQQAYYEKMSEEERDQLVVVQADHVDGGMGSTVREDKLDWLKKADTNKKVCRVLNNVRCLSEGVDVPSLDAIMFLSSRNSQVDVVQSVGRKARRETTLIMSKESCLNPC